MDWPSRPDLALSVGTTSRFHHPPSDTGASPSPRPTISPRRTWPVPLSAGPARDLDMHRTTIDDCLKREGVKQSRRPVLTELQLDEAVAPHVAGGSWSTLATRFDVDPGTVGRALKQRRMKMRPRRGASAQQPRVITMPARDGLQTYPNLRRHIFDTRRPNAVTVSPTLRISKSTRCDGLIDE